MAAADAYRPIDEPLPSGLAHLTVSPMWPLFAAMFGGVWLSWPWFVLNGFAFGSPTRWREAGLAAAGLAGSAIFVLGFVLLVGTETVPKAAVPYALIGLTVWKLGVSYALFTWQTPGYAIHEHFGGESRNGILVVFAGGFARGAVLSAVPPLLAMVIG